ncbi:hypothetical protein NVP1081O_242 [Vibrio phage 1.081.O._10N.286.52.C2]|nr:hypothetical protein NVP1081O_242 [Vibrio phage 1.081.O._10N.286.52.C2]
MEKVKISALVGMMSMVGINGQFPFTSGNYCSNVHDVYFSNIWAENLMHLTSTGVIDDGLIEVLLFTEKGGDYAYVIDERVPKEAIHEPYFCGIAQSTQILRYHYGLPEDECVCEHGFAQGGSFDHKTRWVTKRCGECGQHITSKWAAKGVFHANVRTHIDGFSNSYTMWKIVRVIDNVFTDVMTDEVIEHSDIVSIVQIEISSIPRLEEQRSAISIENFTYVGEVKRNMPDERPIMHEDYLRSIATIG